MEAFTYGNYKIRQQSPGSPTAGDIVEDIMNAEIKIKDKDGTERAFEVRDGKIKREIKGYDIGNMIIAVLFVLMMILMFFLSYLWWTAR
ncbi:MAG: hypothetical protein LAT75_11850 [Candidatus Cyclonatronum sp.]|uniref:hypothetical protein n=1 Tax=Cyclonatronum sp. TaxID=3024185 RepID=UPI0025BCDFD9|nr:hypothetical protein [Cyclonatronum sp.]MCC5935438.1 hypothetical protein [Balneolales bacterium]MCH8487552.1 hypothetical protein [Cyclonatronum sp.]